MLPGENLHCSPLDRPYKAYILAHYPEQVTGNPFDADAVCMVEYFSIFIVSNGIELCSYLLNMHQERVGMCLTNFHVCLLQGSVLLA